MIFKLKDGYEINVNPNDKCNVNTALKIANMAKQKIQKAKDATLTKEIKPGTSFQITKLKAAIKENDMPAVERELEYLKRDVAADLQHKNYPDMYRKAVLEKVVAAYKEAAGVLEPVIAKNDYADLTADIEALEKMWFPVNPTDKPVEDACKAKDDIKPVDVKNALVTVFRETDDGTDVVDGAFVFEDIEDARNMMHAINNGEHPDYPNGWARIEYFTPKNRTEDACKPECKVKDADNLRVCEHCLRGIEAHEGRMITDKIYAEDDEDLICDWCGEGNNTELYEILDKSKHGTHDAPPPYYDPDDAPRIVSNYSPERVLREIAHSEEEGATFTELEDVLAEIDEFIARGRDTLQEAGWTREDARRAIKDRYYTFVTALREAGHETIADGLAARINKLEKVWGLTR